MDNGEVDQYVYVLPTMSPPGRQCLSKEFQIMGGQAERIGL